jgi:hypothetical protein
MTEANLQVNVDFIATVLGVGENCERVERNRTGSY